MAVKATFYVEKSMSQSRLTTNGPLGSSRSTSVSQMSHGLMMRIMEKQGELERLNQLRDHTANLASQLEVLEGKLTTLTDGTESKTEHVLQY